MKTVSVGSLVCMAVVMAGAAYAAGPFTQCPPVGSNPTGCQLLITVTAVNSAGAATSFTVTQSTTDVGPFDGSEDTLIGVLNSSGAVLKSLTIGGGVNSGVFLFDGDGACSGAYTPQPTLAQCGLAAYTTADPADYASSSATFGTIAASGDTGTVLVGGAAGLPNNGTAWFDLEGVIIASQITGGGGGGVPAPSSLVLLGIGLTALFAWSFRSQIARLISAKP